jgi:uncharacterized membrane-anchored protein
MPNALAAIAAGALFAALLPAQNEPPKPSPDGDAPKAARGVEEMLAKYHPQKGAVKVGTKADVKLGDGWLWLDRADGQQFLVSLGNQRSPEVLGVAIPPDFARGGTFAVYTYDDEGHVHDDDVPDYDALLADMKESTVEQSKARKQAGYEAVTLIGWAEPPHYDKEQHKLYWAERLSFEGNDGDTLNYNVRVLGRAGHLVVRGVGDIDQLSEVAAHSKTLLQITEFVEGQRYTDFDPAYDKVAAYGIGGLIAGKIALKIGLLAKLGGLLKLAIKPLIAGVVILGAFLAKLFRGKKKKEEGQSASPA